jgi:uncharacterized protein (TIGR02996 family)
MSILSKLTNEYVYRIAPDGQTVKAARALLEKGAFSQPQTSSDGTFLQAFCQGSEPKPYSVQVNLVHLDNPQAGCNCSSWKHPCKHVLGLLLLGVHSPELFQQGASTDADRPRQKKAPLVDTTARKSRADERRSPADLNESLLQSILADPEDDGPRLIYSDWLEDNGQAERAEFIRLQMELTRLDPSDARLKAMRAREKSLWAAHRDTWLQSLPPDLRKRDIRFHKGFLEELVGPPKVWLEHCESLFAQHPIYRLRLRGTVGRKEAGAVAVVPQLARVRRLVLAGCRLVEPSKTLEILFGTPFLSSLRGIDLSGGKLSWREIEALVASPVVGQVLELDLSENEIGPKGAETLAESASMKNLQELSLANNPLGDAGGRALARSGHLARLARLDLSGVTLGEGTRTMLRERFNGPVVLDQVRNSISRQRRLS